MYNFNYNQNWILKNQIKVIDQKFRKKEKKLNTENPTTSNKWNFKILWKN